MVVVLPNHMMSVQCKKRHDSGVAKLHNVFNVKIGMIVVSPNYIMPVQYKDRYDIGIAK